MILERKIKVLETIRQGKVGGGESHLVSLVDYLDKSAYEPVVLSFTDGPMINRLRQSGIKCYVISTEKAFNMNVWDQVKQIIKNEQIDIVHAHGTRAYTNVLWPAHSLNIPVMYTVHGWSFHEDQHVLIKRMRVFIENMLVNHAQLTISVSETNQSSGRRYMPGLSSVVINNGIDLHRFDPDRTYKDIRAEFGIPKDVILFGYISRITKQKDPIGMIDAFSRVLAHTKDIRLLMIGEGDLQEQAMERVKELALTSYVYFDNFRQDVPELLNGIDIYCLPSLWEGFPIGLLEAMAMGKAVIATNVDGSKEIIQSHNNGILIAPSDSSALSDAMVALCDDQRLRGKLQANAKQTITQKYNAATMTKTTEALYDSIFTSCSPTVMQFEGVVKFVFLQNTINTLFRLVYGKSKQPNIQS